MSKLTAEEWAKFVRLWNDAESPDEVAGRLGIRRHAASARAVKAREMGLPAKKFKEQK